MDFELYIQAVQDVWVAQNLKKKKNLHFHFKVKLHNTRDISLNWEATQANHTQPIIHLTDFKYMLKWN